MPIVTSIVAVDARTQLEMHPEGYPMRAWTSHTDFGAAEESIRTHLGAAHVVLGDWEASGTTGDDGCETFSARIIDVYRGGPRIELCQGTMDAETFARLVTFVREYLATDFGDPPADLCVSDTPRAYAARDYIGNVWDDEVYADLWECIQAARDEFAWEQSSHAAHQFSKSG